MEDILWAPQQNITESSHAHTQREIESLWEREREVQICSAGAGSELLSEKLTQTQITEGKTLLYALYF